MTDGIFRFPEPTNEPALSYAAGTKERERLVRELTRTAGEVAEIPVALAGERITKERRTTDVVMPHAHAHVLARLHHATAADVRTAIDRGLAASKAWRELPFAERAAIFLRAADMLAGPARERVDAACMLGQSKTVYQSEIDAVCELADFWRWNVHFAERLYAEQPRSPHGTWNRADYRPLEGFVLAVTPFNFSSIGLNLPSAPALMGNVVLWKPASTSTLACWRSLEVLHAAGLPEGVIQFLPGDGPEQGQAALESEHLAGIHFTGSTRTFRALWKGVAERLEHYRSFPRIVGETGGKDFMVVHPSADVDSVATAVLRGGFEYQGQKCSALSRLYLPRSLAAKVKERLVAELAQVKMGDPRDFGNFVGAVIDEPAFRRISEYVALAKSSAKVLAGGTCDGSVGWFVQPTLVEVDDPSHRLMCEEIFGPVVTLYVYEDEKWHDVLALVDRTSPYGLTGAVMARDRAAILEAQAELVHAAGNFYVNDKPTGAVVGQQPFGGARQSGTNDKAGAMWNLVRWVSPRSIKETFVPPTDWRYPFLDR